jgi:hypothetical protein
MARVGDSALQRVGYLLTPELSAEMGALRGTAKKLAA